MSYILLHSDAIPPWINKYEQHRSPHETLVAGRGCTFYERKDSYWLLFFIYDLKLLPSYLAKRNILGGCFSANKNLFIFGCSYFTLRDRSGFGYWSVLEA